MKILDSEIAERLSSEAESTKTDLKVAPQKYCLIPTEYRDMLSLFSIVRFVWTRASGVPEEMMFFFVSIGPYLEDEECCLWRSFWDNDELDSLKKFACEFRSDDRLKAISCVVLAMSLRIDFFIKFPNSEILGFHSHDCGMYLRCGPESLKSDLVGLGMAETL